VEIRSYVPRSVAVKRMQSDFFEALQNHPNAKLTKSIELELGPSACCFHIHPMKCCVKGMIVVRPHIVQFTGTLQRMAPDEPDPGRYIGPIENLIREVATPLLAH